MGIFDLFNKNKDIAEPNVNDGSERIVVGQNIQTNRFSFDNFEKDLPEILDIAENSITQLMESMGKEYNVEWSWGQREPSMFSPMNLCLYYDKYVLCIYVTLYREQNGEGQFCMEPQNMDDLISLCTKYNMTPCLFVIDSYSGAPLVPIPYLTDARTHELIDFSELTEDNGDIMSEWELLINGINRVLNNLAKEGARISSYCNIPGSFPNIFYTKDGENCYAIVRSIPGGLSKEKYNIRSESLQKFIGLKGFFIDVLWGNLAWILDDLKDTQLKRSDYPFYIDCHINTKPIEEAIKECAFIEIVEGES